MRFTNVAHRAKFICLSRGIKSKENMLDFDSFFVLFIPPLNEFTLFLVASDYCT